MGLEAQLCPSGLTAIPRPPSSMEAKSAEFVPTIRSGSFADIGPRKSMEDEHVRIDNLSVHLGPSFRCPMPSAFYAIFDGHGGPEAAVYIRENAMRFFFEEARFPQAIEADEVFFEEVENALHKAFLLADRALADHWSISASTGTTALIVLVLGRRLMVANVGDCRAVVCCKGEAIEMSRDHKPVCPVERRRVEETGGYVDNGYLNGVLSVTRSLGDWEMKLPRGSPSALIAEPELRQIVLTEDDEFLVMGCDGIWDVMSSQEAVDLVRRGLKQHGSPDRCARDLSMAALRLEAFDNLTAVVVCLTPLAEKAAPPTQRLPWRPRFRCSEAAIMPPGTFPGAC